MRFQVPQFIEVEDKLFGPLTFKQFIYVVGGVGFSVVLFLFLPTFLAIIITLPIALFAAALAFYKINNRPFVNIVEAFVKYTLTNKLYIWHKVPNDNRQSTVDKANAKPIQQVYVPKLSRSKLKELTWNLDIKENQNPITEEKI
ncbi:MAG: PrgI family protein [bacterium]|nr:PrgI family protein [bacterium]